MFTANTHVAAAFEDRPVLRDMLAAYNPEFARLHDPARGRTIPRFITVADAALIAGIPVASLIDIMNLHDLDEGPCPPGLGRELAMPRWMTGCRRFGLDACAILERGENPLPAILAALRETGPDEVLVIYTPREPRALVEVLDRQGWAHHVFHLTNQCQTAFGHPLGGIPTSARTPLSSRVASQGTDWRLDLRHLDPTEALRLLFEALADAAMPPLVVVHEHEPVMLRPRLEMNGIPFESGPANDGWETRFSA
jgi:hypothetical protein